MRIWDLPPERLCRNHLLAEHREIHAIWNIITMKKSGYSRHPETLRWVGKLKALFLRHQQIAQEMENRGFKHNSPLNPNLAGGSSIQDKFVDDPLTQIKILKSKGCPCRF
ncbi:MAG: pyrimidine dimer DNA glycosylase/endonuclease V [Caldiserica bacterium]|jgi:hypothetical protein|nr:pyrimidine dimer DNA glycosylase/endonuclease V [Caldisericota bacterium]MDH7562001.1 pyrimidine dimer DNA glycosylase/endonuclease V [Caldisericota bacterium]